MPILQHIRKDPLGWCIIALLALVVIVALTRTARSHIPGTMRIAG
jgi:hypothetical protein